MQRIVHVRGGPIVVPVFVGTAKDIGLSRVGIVSNPPCHRNPTTRQICRNSEQKGSFGKEEEKGTDPV